jgi:hypothetical protein
MRRAILVAPVLFLATGFCSAELIASQRTSETELKKEICDAFLTWLKENEQSPEYKAAQKKSRNERTEREQTTFEAVEAVRTDIERCGKVT